MIVTTPVVFIQGGGAGAHREDAQLVDSLKRNLGDDFTVEFLRMPHEDAPDYERWRPVIGRAIDRATAPVVLVGHSVGGYLLIKYLASETATSTIAAVCIIAAPFPAGDPSWSIDGFELPDDFAERLPKDVPVLLYASEDDAIVPFAHRDLYAAAIPHAYTRSTFGGHQLAGDLRVVADDIRRIFAQ